MRIYIQTYVTLILSTVVLFPLYSNDVPVLDEHREAIEIAMLNAARQGDDLTLEALFNLPDAWRPNINAQEAETGNTALMLALLNRRREVALLLLEQPEIDASITDIHGSTPLHAATLRGYHDVVERMLSLPTIARRPRINAHTGGRSAADIANMTNRVPLAHLINRRARRFRNLDAALENATHLQQIA